jgi:glycosyltransferase involved in cell wall biosynthesis
MNSQPLVSVLTPCFNHCEYLEDYFQSLLDQSYKNIELIIIDDASIDGSWEMILSFEKRLKLSFPRVFLQHNSTNLGLIPTLDKLKQHINGEFVAILESDDYYKPGMLASCVDFLLRNPDIGAVHSDVDFLYPDRIDQDHWASLGRTIRQGEIFEHLLIDNFILTCTFCCRSDLFLEHADFNKYIQRGYLTADYPLFLDLARHTNFGYIDRSLAVYRVVRNSISHPDDLTRQLSWKEAYYRIKLDNILDYGASSSVRHRAEKQYHRTLLESGYYSFQPDKFIDAYRWLSLNYPGEFKRLPYRVRNIAMHSRLIWNFLRQIEQIRLDYQM